jgi:hypothetical protein
MKKKNQKNTENEINLFEEEVRLDSEVRSRLL